MGAYTCSKCQESKCHHSSPCEKDGKGGLICYECWDDVIEEDIEQESID
jgi:hypothetical protein